MAEERKSSLEMKTWIEIQISEVPKSTHVLTTKWKLKVERNEDHSFERFKACLVVQGNLKRHGIDYDESYAPVIDLDLDVLSFLEMRRSAPWCTELTCSTRFLKETSIASCLSKKT